MESEVELAAPAKTAEAAAVEADGDILVLDIADEELSADAASLSVPVDTSIVVTEEAAFTGASQPSASAALAADTEETTAAAVSEEEEDAVASGSDTVHAEDSDDPVVREIDVYIKRLDTVADNARTYLLQYPLRPLYRPYGDQGQLLEVAYREQQHTLHFTYGLSMENENFDNFRHPLQCGSSTSKRSGANSSAAGSQQPGWEEVVVKHQEEARSTTNNTSSNSSSSRREYVPTHALKSQLSFAEECSYAVGVLKGDKLFLTPVDHVVQFRPDFSHVDAWMQQQQFQQQPHRHSHQHHVPSASVLGVAPRLVSVRNSNNNKNSSHSSPSVAAQSAAVATKTVAAGGGGRARVSHSRQRDIEESEPWIVVEDFYDADTPEAFDIVKALCAETPGSAFLEEAVAEKKKPDAALIAKGGGAAPPLLLADVESAAKAASAGGLLDIYFVSDAESYLRHLCGSSRGAADLAIAPLATISSSSNAAQTGVAGSAAAGPLGYAALSKLPFDKQVYTILFHRRVETFENVKKFLTVASPDDKALLRLLLEYGVLVLGNWVIKSFFLYDDLYKIACRDLLLALLIRHGSSNSSSSVAAAGASAGGGVPKEAFRSATRLPMECVIEMLGEVAVCVSSVWRFRLPFDFAFVKKFPSLQKHFDSWWAQRLQQVVREIQQRRDGASPLPQQQASADKATTTDSSNSNVSAALLQLAARLGANILKQQGALTFEEFKKNLIEKNEEFSTISDTNLQKNLSGFAMKVGEVWLLKKAEQAYLEVYRNSLIKILSEQKTPLTKHSVVQALTQTLKRRLDLPDFALRRLLRELAVSDEGYWIFKGRLKEIKKETNI